MTRLLLAAVVTVALIGGWLAAPDPVPVDPAPGLEPAASDAAVCPLRLDRTADGKLTLASTVVAPARVTVGSAGAVVTDRSVAVDEGGGGSVQFSDLTIGGASGAFVEFGESPAAAGTVSRGASGVTAVACQSLIRTTALIPGASTRNGESLELVLVNPYGSDAVVVVESSSEIGTDSADELSSVVVPARSTVTRSLTTLLPLRNRLSLAITPTRGLVHAFVEGAGRGDRVMIEAVDPGGEWITPVPRFDGQEAFLVVATTSPVDVAIRVDGWTEGTFVEGVFSEVLAARGQLEIPLSELEFPLDIAQILADGPIAVSIVVEGEAGRAVTPANVQAMPEWLMPGPGSAGSIAWVGAADETDAIVEFLSLTAGGESFTIDVPAGTVAAVALNGEPTGYTLRSDSPITVVWSVSDDTGIGLGAPIPLPGGE